MRRREFLKRAIPFAMAAVLIVSTLLGIFASIAV